MNGSYDQNGVKRISKAYKMKRDSIRMLLESPNIDLGNAIECHNVSFGYNKKSQVLSNISINVPKGNFLFWVFLRNIWWVKRGQLLGIHLTET